MLLVHEGREDNPNHVVKPLTNTTLYSSVNNSGKSKTKWNKNRNNNKGTSRGADNSSINSSTNHVSGTSSGQQSQFVGVMGSHPSETMQRFPQQPPIYFYGVASSYVGSSLQHPIYYYSPSGQPSPSPMFGPLSTGSAQQALW